MKVVHIITGLKTGGAEMMLYRLLSQMDRCQFEPVVISLMDEGTLGKQILNLNVPIYCLNLDFHFWSATKIHNLYRIIKKNSPDLIQAWMYHANLVAFLGKIFSNSSIPILWNIRQSLYSFTYEKLSTSLIIRLGQYYSKFPEKIIYNSISSARHHEDFGYNTQKTVVIPNGFDVNIFKPSKYYYAKIRQDFNIKKNGLVIGLIGRFHPMKDHANFLNAARLLLDRHPNLDVRFLLCGSGVDPGNPILADLTNELGLENNVYFLGERHDIPYLTAALDIAVSSSLSESFPNVVGEAMACGVTCTVTDVGDSAWIVGNTGKVVPSKNAEALAKAWENLIKIGAEGRYQLGQAARRRIVDHFSLESVANQYGNLYQSVVRH